MNRRKFFSKLLTLVTPVAMLKSNEIEKVKLELSKQGYKEITVTANPYGSGYMIKGEK